MSTTARASNNFDAMRLAAAGAVMFGHAYELTGRDIAPRVLGAPLHSLGVFVFFIMSGYLIATSWQRRPVLTDFLRNRVLRIFPGLIAVTLLTAFVLGPVFTSAALSDYLGSERTWRYLTNMVLRPSYDLPGVFTGLPVGGSVNGSLWTLPVEFVCYLLVPLVLLVPRRIQPATIVAVAVGLAVLGRTIPEREYIVYGTSFTRVALLAVFFLGGALLAVLPKLALRTDVGFGLLGVLVVGSSVLLPVDSRVLLWLFLPYVVISFCVGSTPVLSQAARFGDLSYGMYIYAFPTQQVVVSVLPGLPFLVNFALVVVLTTILAFCSWHLVEKRAMRFKAGGVRNREMVSAVNAHHVDT